MKEKEAEEVERGTSGDRYRDDIQFSRRLATCNRSNSGSSDERGANKDDTEPGTRALIVAGGVGGAIASRRGSVSIRL